MDLRYYDERYYLSDYFKNERNFILELQSYCNEVYDSEQKKYSSLISDYNVYLKSVSKLVDEITGDKDSLTKINVIRYLIMKGVFSHTDKFIIKSGVNNILFSKSGLNVIDGIGCCRHISEFIADVSPELSILTCASNVDNSFDNLANHVINLVRYDGVTYGYDALNKGILYKFLGSLNLCSLNCGENIYYKPYAEIALYKRSFEEIEVFLDSNKAKDIKSITCLKELLIKFKAYMNVVNNTELINDFKSSTNEELDVIKEQINEIKIKQKDV